jgi:hypothetical protein
MKIKWISSCYARKEEQKELQTKKKKEAKG